MARQVNRQTIPLGLRTQACDTCIACINSVNFAYTNSSLRLLKHLMLNYGQIFGCFCIYVLYVSKKTLHFLLC